ncbi:uncharacterized protein LOC133664625 isoform X2 [Entelurus aequoreus]|uniref:uncharacterized protein LOC133664625 isoform X2 n=1 Tax=Entelurus aequoreus TaxID=161455 RepID=UPI002B1E4D07|nr:uncharacterized protein LOC133664625 isoform X2 [Entelurus aequoreus]
MFFALCFWFLLVGHVNCRITHKGDLLHNQSGQVDVDFRSDPPEREPWPFGLSRLTLGHRMPRQQISGINNAKSESETVHPRTFSRKVPKGQLFQSSFNPPGRKQASFSNNQFPRLGSYSVIGAGQFAPRRSEKQKAPVGVYSHGSASQSNTRPYARLAKPVSNKVSSIVKGLTVGNQMSAQTVFISDRKSKGRGYSHVRRFRPWSDRKQPNSGSRNVKFQNQNKGRSDSSRVSRTNIYYQSVDNQFIRRLSLPKQVAVQGKFQPFQRLSHPPTVIHPSSEKTLHQNVQLTTSLPVPVNATVGGTVVPFTTVAMKTTPYSTHTETPLPQSTEAPSELQTNSLQTKQNKAVGTTTFDQTRIEHTDVTDK